MAQDFVSKKPKAKILYIITKSNWGGAQKYVYDLATSDIQKRFDVTVITSGDGELIKKLVANKIKVIVIKSLSRDVKIIKDIKSMLELAREIKKINPDIVHLNSSKIGLLGGVVCRIIKIKTIIFTAHGWPFSENRNMLSKFIFRILMQIAVLMSHRTIAVAKSTIDSLRPLKKVKSKMHIIYNGLREIEYKQLPKLSSGSSMRHVVSIGELHPSKNHISVIRVLKHIKGVHYHIIGSGELASKIKEEIAKDKLENRVTMHGHINMASNILTQFDLFLLPSRTEQLPYVVNEALMAGLPVIARAVGGIPEILENNPQGRLYSHDSELISLLNEFNPQTKRSIDSKFRYETMINETKNLYLSLLK